VVNATSSRCEPAAGERRGTTERFLRVAAEPGGLVSALEPVMRRTDGVWIGWSGMAGTGKDRWDTAGMHLVGVPLSADEVERFYEGSATPRCGRSTTT